MQKASYTAKIIQKSFMMVNTIVDMGGFQDGLLFEMMLPTCFKEKFHLDISLTLFFKKMK